MLWMENRMLIRTKGSQNQRMSGETCAPFVRHSEDGLQLQEAFFIPQFQKAANRKIDKNILVRVIREEETGLLACCFKKN